MERIKYIAYYDTVDSTENRYYCLAATTKMEYIISTLNSNGIAVDLISYSYSVEKKILYYHGSVRQFGINTVRLFPSLGGYANLVMRKIGHYYKMLFFILWFLLNVKKDEKIIVYHSLGYSRLLIWLQKIKKCSYIGEIEEIYQDVSRFSLLDRKSENAFISVCDKYIFPTDLLNNKINISNKINLIIHGLYSVEAQRKRLFDDNKIHIVYAGTFDPNKGGGAAAAAALYLPSIYHIHILGFGTDNEINKIKKVIEEVTKKSEAKVTYDGLLKGEDFIQFIQSCQVGLSTQNPDAAFNLTSFPSKILTYLSNGLHVVSIRIESVENSLVGNCITYYDIQSPENIASAIKSINLDKPYDSRELITKLDKNFVKEIGSFIK